MSALPGSELQARLAKTRDYLQSVPREAFAGAEERHFTTKAGASELQFVGQPYLLHSALPNFFFHVTTAYAIVRDHGVELGKRDFLGRA